MFAKTHIIQANTIETFDFEKDKKYLLLIGQSANVETEKLSNKASDIYAIVAPAVIYEGELYDDAIVVCELKQETSVVYCTKEKEAPKDLLSKSQSVLVFVDWLDAGIYQCLDKLFSLTGDNIAILGAGCGRSNMQNDGIITKNGIEKKDGFLVLFSEAKMVVEARHGAIFHDGYYTVRMKNSNTIATINGEDASSFYIKMVKKLFNEEVNSENIFDMGVKYPLGLGAITDEQPLRVPVALDGGNLVVAGPIEDESVLSLMHSTHESMLNATNRALIKTKTRIDALEEKECFLVECMGRKALLGEHFNDELKAVSNHFANMKKVYGILSLGEIANGCDQYIEYFNETCAVGVF